MKKIFLFLFLSISLISCSGNDPEPEDDIIIPLELNKQLVYFEKGVTTGKLKILKGNGNYKIVKPKSIEVDAVSINDSDNYLDISIKENEIFIETVVQNKEIRGFYLLTDNKNQEIMFVVANFEAYVMYKFDDLYQALLRENHWDL